MRRRAGFRRPFFLPLLARTRTLLIQRGNSESLILGNLQYLTRGRVVRCRSAVGYLPDLAVCGAFKVEPGHISASPPRRSISTSYAATHRSRACTGKGDSNGQG
jgi:hypothetical protein